MKKDLMGKSAPFGWQGYIKGLIVELIITAILVVVFAFVMYVSGAAVKYAAVLATVSVAAGSFCGAFMAAKTIKNKGWLVGAVIGGITFLIVTLISLVINNNGVTSNTLFHFIIIMLASLIGGVLGVNKGNNHNYI